MVFKVGDRVRCISVGRGNSRYDIPDTVVGKKYTISHVSAPLSGEVLVGVDGQKQGCYYARRFEKVEESVTFNVGDKVRVTDYKAVPEQNGAEGEVTNLHGWRMFPEGGQSFIVKLTKSSPSGWGYIGQGLNFVTGEVEHITEAKPANTTGAMGREQALAQVRRLQEVGVSKDKIRLVTRSWDTEARFFAVDISKNSGGIGVPEHHFVNVRQIDEFLENQKPIDVAARRTSLSSYPQEPVYQFVVNGDYVYVNDVTWIRRSTIEKGNGVFKADDGKRYRPVKTITVPLLDERG